MANSLIFGLVGFAIYLVLMPFLLRLCSRTPPALLVIVFSVLIYLILLAAAKFVAIPLFFWVFSAAYWFFSLCFLMVFGAVYKSISLRILLDLYHCTGHANSYQAVLDRYVRHESYQDRLQIMVGERFASLDERGFSLAPKGRRIAAVVMCLQKIFRIEKSG
jgi:hypothetical protein